MTMTLILALCFILVILMMLYAAVALVQDKRLFGSAPKDIVDAIQPPEERFKGARLERIDVYNNSSSISTLTYSRLVGMMTLISAISQPRPSTSISPTKGQGTFSSLKSSYQSSCVRGI